MDYRWAFFVFCWAGVFIFWVLISAALQGRRRREALRVAGEKLGFTFQARGKSAAAEGLAQLPLFDPCAEGLLVNYLTRTEEGGEVEESVFDYHYLAGGEGARMPRRQTVFVYSCSSVTFPSFVLEPDDFFHMVGEFFGPAGIDFGSHPVFSKKYRVKGLDEEAIRECFSEEVLSVIESMDWLHVQACGDKMIFFRTGLTVRPEELGSVIDEYTKFKDLFLSSVSSAQKAGHYHLA